MKRKTIKSAITLKAPLTLVFDTLFKSDLLQVFTNLWFVPRFTYPIQKNQYFKTGFEHTIHFENGSMAMLKFNTYIPDLSFSAVVHHFSFCSYKALCSMEYHFYFSEDLHKDNCTISCKYHFKFRSLLWSFLFEIFARKKIQQNIDSFLTMAAQKLGTHTSINF